MAAGVQVLTDTAASDLAWSVAARAAGRSPQSLVRFTTGLDHHVFEAAFADRAPLVIRVGRAETREQARTGLTLHRQLRGLGVPLPEIVAAELDGPLPCVVLERLAGSDLGAVIGNLSAPLRAAIAEHVAAAQAITARIESAGRYGYAAVAAQAPFAVWSAVPEANVARSRARMAQAGLFDLHVVEQMEALLAQNRAALDAQPATPFLHDTTTKNVIVAEDGSFSGIVDVDDLCFGDPRYPAALTLASLSATGDPADYVDIWMRAAGHQDDRIFRIYVALFLVDFMAEHGQSFNGNKHPSSPEARANLLRCFEDALRRIG